MTGLRRVSRWAAFAALVLAVVVYAAVLAGGAGAATGVSITTQPGLFPNFDPSVSDYITRCTAGSPVRVTVSTSGAARVSVDGAPYRKGSFSQNVALNAGQAFRLRVDRGSTITTHYVRCVPSDFPQYTFSRTGTPQAEYFIAAPTFALGQFGS